MPTSLTIDSLSVSIRVGENDLEVYDPKYDEETRTASYWLDCFRDGQRIRGGTKETSAEPLTNTAQL